MAGKLDRIEALLAAVRVEFAPDPRTAVFEVEARLDGDSLALVGATSEPAAAAVLHRRAAQLDGWAEVRDEVTLLPDPRVEVEGHAVVTVALAPMLAAPMIAEVAISQVVLGHRVRVLRRLGRWLHCRSAEGYLGWIHRGYLAPMSESDARAWESGTEGEACVSLGAELRSEEDEVLARLPWAARVLRQPDGWVRLPGGGVGKAVGELIPLVERPLRFPSQGEAVVRSALQWLGAPYFWGGVTLAGVDCSGFVQALLRMHGVELPRDSDQQAEVGELVNPGRNLARLQAGDLLFFAEEGGRVTHVALSMGGTRIIHSSLGNGGVFRNDLAGPLPYERELREIFVCARRHL